MYPFRVFQPAPPDVLTLVEQELTRPEYEAGQACMHLIKTAGDPVVSPSLAGEFYISESGWGLLKVPNAVVRGLFDALHEPGAELPPRKSGGGLNAHISVIRPEEIEQIGGVDKITERGHAFKYNIGPLHVVEPAGWKEMSKVWYVEVRSPELEALRKSYGLSPRPKNNEFDFHITVAVRRKHVLRNNDVRKAPA